MATRFSSLLLLLFLFTLQEMVMRSAEAVLCSAPSRVFRGLCFSKNNCGAICEKEGFLFGECKVLKCLCRKNCGVGGDNPPEQEPPSEGPPEQGPPSEGPPEQDPPAEGPPEQGPPSEGPPEQDPSVESSPEQGPDYGSNHGF